MTPPPPPPRPIKRLKKVYSMIIHNNNKINSDHYLTCWPTAAGKKGGLGTRRRLLGCKRSAIICTFVRSWNADGWRERGGTGEKKLLSFFTTAWMQSASRGVRQRTGQCRLSNPGKGERAYILLVGISKIFSLKKGRCIECPPPLSALCKRRRWEIRRMEEGA